MKKIIVLFFIISFVTACGSTPPLFNPNAGPELTVRIPELYSPDPDVVDDKLPIGITINHPARIKSWEIQIQPISRGSEGEGGQRRAVFFRQSGEGTPPKTWLWDGRFTSGGAVQSATDYQFNLSVTDVYDNKSIYEGTISVDVLVMRYGEKLRIIVPSIIFPRNSANLSQVTEEDMRENGRVLQLIADALNKYKDYLVTVEGHANPTTPPNTPERAAEERNDMLLSEQRAQAVTDYLVDNGNVGRGRLTAMGMSCTKPIADYDDDGENWKNRRVEFILQK